MSKHSITNLIRQYCDGELNDEQIAQVQQHLQDHPEDQAIVESERKLRKRIEAVVKADCPHAPAGLADQIKSEFTKQSVSSDSEEETYAYSPRSWSFGPNKANVFAVAASIVLVVGAVLFGIFGNPIDRRVPELNRIAEAVSSVGLEHMKAASDPGRFDRPKSKCISCEDASRDCKRLFKTDIPVLNLSSSGYTFKEGMECEVPHSGKAYHLFYKQVNGNGLVSVHIVKDVGQLGLQDAQPFEGDIPLKTAQIFLDNGDKNWNPSVLTFSDGEMAYMVMLCMEIDTEQVIRSIQESIVKEGR